MLRLGRRHVLTAAADGRRRLLLTPVLIYMVRLKGTTMINVWTLLTAVLIYKVRLQGTTIVNVWTLLTSVLIQGTSVN